MVAKDPEIQKSKPTSSPLDDVYTAPYAAYAKRILDEQMIGSDHEENPLSKILKKEKEGPELWTPERVREQIDWQFACYQSEGMNVPEPEDIDYHYIATEYHAEEMNKIMAAGFEPMLLTTPFCEAGGSMSDMWYRLFHRSGLRSIYFDEGDYKDSDINLPKILLAEQQNFHIKSSALTSELPEYINSYKPIHWHTTVTTRQALTTSERLELAAGVGYDESHISEIMLSEYLAARFLRAREDVETVNIAQAQLLGFSYMRDVTFPKGLAFTALGGVLKPVTFLTVQQNKEEYLYQSSWSR